MCDAGLRRYRRGSNGSFWWRDSPATAAARESSETRPVRSPACRVPRSPLS
jgi:hypothetical protein